MRTPATSVAAAISCWAVSYRCEKALSLTTQSLSLRRGLTADGPGERTTLFVSGAPTEADFLFCSPLPARRSGLHNHVKFFQQRRVVTTDWPPTRKHVMRGFRSSPCPPCLSTSMKPTRDRPFSQTASSTQPCFSPRISPIRSHDVAAARAPTSTACRMRTAGHGWFLVIRHLTVWGG